MRDTENILEIIDHLLESLESVEPASAPLKLWMDRSQRLLSGIILPAELDSMKSLGVGTASYNTDMARYKSFLVDLKKGIVLFPEMYLVREASVDHRPEKVPLLVRKSLREKDKVFIVHGHADFEKLEVARTVERLGLEAIILHEQPNKGRAIIEKFEENASDVGFAIILMTPDDVGYPKDHPDKAQSRARQNVILELGYFSGLLGRKNICVLYKGNVEIPTDYLGVIYTRLDEVGAWRVELAKEMKLAGLDVDLNRL